MPRESAGAFLSAPSCVMLAAIASSLAGCRAESQAATKSVLVEAPAGPRAEMPAGPRAEVPSSMEDDGQWRMAAKDYAGLRFSKLSQIDVGNVASLKVAWTFSTGVLKGHEGAPLVVGDAMYVVTPFPNRLYALDLAQPGAPVKWMFDPAASPSSQGVACCDVVNRGAAYDNGRIYYNALDDQTIAVDASTGREIWRTRLGDINKGETMTMAPLVVKGKVLVGNSGGEMGV